MEYLIPRKCTVKILCKSKHFPRRYKWKREWVFFSEHSVYVCLLRMCVDDVLPMTCNEECEMTMEPLDEMSLDGMSRLLCAFLNTSQYIVLVCPALTGLVKSSLVVVMDCILVLILARVRENVWNKAKICKKSRSLDFQKNSRFVVLYSTIKARYIYNQHFLYNVVSMSIIELF